MNYFDIKQRHSDEFSQLSIFWAFSTSQFEKGMEELGVTDKKDLCSIPGGGFMRKCDTPQLLQLIERHDKEMEAAKADQEFLINAIAYELANHEYEYTGDPSPALDVLEIDLNNDFHKKCFKAAKALVLQSE